MYDIAASEEGYGELLDEMMTSLKLVKPGENANCMIEGCRIS